MGITQMIAPSPDAARDAAVAIAQKIAACAPLGIKATLASARLVIDPVEADALSKLDAQYSALYSTEDLIGTFQNFRSRSFNHIELTFPFLNHWQIRIAHTARRVNNQLASGRDVYGKLAVNPRRRHHE